MARVSFSAAERRDHARCAATTRKDTLAWAKATYARFPVRTDLRDLIAEIEAKGAKSRAARVSA